ncbi:hypothetical protein Pcinc_004497 [Petrolisthes cinctipes]|uniref:Uncharacterized protein n=1 Tax=Petrolisthes cinctipes TaxID=88211 RepID=A0AAE1L080_PETCI|nr:hypothetical protein Pcinc_004497 [Petrolisthes cinctipes]
MVVVCHDVELESGPGGLESGPGATREMAVELWRVLGRMSRLTWKVVVGRFGVRRETVVVFHVVVQVVVGQFGVKRVVVVVFCVL